jgi:hypothetical protein
MYVNKALDGIAWNTNWQKIVNWLTSGKYNIKVKNLEISQGGGITNNGSLTQNGDLTVTGDLEVGSLKANGIIEGDGSKLYNLQTQGVQSFTPFTVNSGNLNNGNADLIQANAVTEGGVITKFTIDFLVSEEYGSIRATTADGDTFELAHLLSDELAANNTFYYFIGRGQTAPVRLTDITIFRQNTTPSGSINDVWLDTSTENLVCKKLSEAGIWEKWDYVPLGKVVIADIGTKSATATVTTFPYNQNGYSVNTVNGVCFPDYSAGISITNDWTATDNGLIVASGHLTTNESWSVAVNSVTILSNATGGSSTHSDVRLNCFVKKGDVVTRSLNGGDATLSLTFYPLQKIG